MACPTLVAVLITSAVSYFVLASADGVETMLGDTGIRILTRVMGLMLTAIAFQFFVSAFVDLRIIAPVALSQIFRGMPVSQRGTCLQRKSMSKLAFGLCCIGEQA